MKDSEKLTEILAILLYKESPKSDPDLRWGDLPEAEREEWRERIENARNTGELYDEEIPY